MWQRILALCLTVSMILSIPACTPIPATEETSFSEEEVRAYIWNHLPKDLSGGYKKAQFSPSTQNVTYLGNKKWQYEISGSGEIIQSLPEQIQGEGLSGLEKYWIWYRVHSENVITYQLRLTAYFYENTRTIEILGIDKFNEETTRKTSKTPIYPELLVDRLIEKEESGGWYQFSGSIVNTGEIPLDDAQVVVYYKDFDSSTKLKKSDYIYKHREGMTYVDYMTYRHHIEPSEKANFMIRFRETELDLYFYYYEFVTAYGHLITFHETEEVIHGWFD